LGEVGCRRVCSVHRWTIRLKRIKIYTKKNNIYKGQGKTIKTDIPLLSHLESKFEEFRSQRITFMRRRKKKKMLEGYLTPSVKHGGGNAMVWSGRFVQGKRDLEEGRLSLHFATPCHTLWTVLNWSQFSSYNRIMTQSQLVFCL
jgi:hypothetical protein